MLAQGDDANGQLASPQPEAAPAVPFDSVAQARRLDVTRLHDEALDILSAPLSGRC